MKQRERTLLQFTSARSCHLVCQLRAMLTWLMRRKDSVQRRLHARGAGGVVDLIVQVIKELRSQDICQEQAVRWQRVVTESKYKQRIASCKRYLTSLFVLDI